MRNLSDACRVCAHAKEFTLAECMAKCNVLYLVVKDMEKRRKEKK